MRDKIPKGDYIIRTSVMDRLVENKLYYKFIEYGQRVREQMRVDKDLEKQNNKGIDGLLQSRRNSLMKVLSQDDKYEDPFERDAEAMEVEDLAY
jgi:hypothetical protein